MNPLFSIIIPVYNVAPYLRECLDSVLAAARELEKVGGESRWTADVEIICVDDGSTDGSGEILDEWGREKIGGENRWAAEAAAVDSALRATHESPRDSASADADGCRRGERRLTSELVAAPPRCQTPSGRGVPRDTKSTPNDTKRELSASITDDDFIAAGEAQGEISFVTASFEDREAAFVTTEPARPEGPMRRGGEGRACSASSADAAHQGRGSDPTASAFRVSRRSRKGSITLRVIHQPNAGVSAARNAGLKNATGDYVCFVDGDDSVDSRWLAVASQALKDHPVDLLRMGLSYRTDGEEIPDVGDIGGCRVLSDRNTILSWGWKEFLQRGWSVVNFIRRDVLDKRRVRFPLQVSMREDNLFLLDVLSDVRTVKMCDFAGYLYRQRQGSAVFSQHSRNAQSAFRRELRSLWKGVESELREVEDFDGIQSLYRFNLRQRMAPEWRWNPIRLVRRLFEKLTDRPQGKSLCFILPGPCTAPVGGFKIAYEYANRIAARGWRVTLAHPLTTKTGGIVRDVLRHPRSNLIELWGAVRTMMGQRFGAGRWFRIDPRVKVTYPLQLTNRWARSFPKGTKFVATYVTTVEALNRLEVAVEDKVNFIQDYEAWFGRDPSDIDKTYRYAMKKIAIADWLVEKVREAGSEAVCVPNGLDFDYFKMNAPIEGRKATEVAMLWHCDERKRTEDAVAALKIVQGRHPDLHVTAFGVPDEPARLPDWITYVQKPDQARHNQIYNTAAIFVQASEQEGMALTPCEAMQCGAAFVGTDIGGFKTVAMHGQSALLSPVRDPEKLAANICRLIEDDALRVQIAKAGHEYVKQFTWERAVEGLVEGLKRR